MFYIDMIWHVIVTEISPDEVDLPPPVAETKPTITLSLKNPICRMAELVVPPPQSLDILLNCY